VENWKGEPFLGSQLKVAKGGGTLGKVGGKGSGSPTKKRGGGLKRRRKFYNGQ